MVNCTMRGSHAPSSENHMLVRGGRNGAQSSMPSNWSAGDVGGGTRCGRRLMGRSKSGYENVNLQDSINPVSGDLEETIHDNEEVTRNEGMMQLLFLEGCVSSKSSQMMDRSRASSRKKRVSSRREKLMRKKKATR
jgi:hypothetical protein